MIKLIEKYWKQILIGVVVLILLSIIFKSCSGERDLRAQAKDRDRQVQQLQRDLAAQQTRFAQDSAEKEQILRQYDTLITDMTAEISKKEGDVRTYISRIRRLQSSAIEVKVPADTTEYVRKMDSAAAEFDDLASKYTALMISMDELISTQASKDSVQQAFINQLKSQLNATREAYLQVLDKYNILYKDFGKVARKAKNRQLLNKILAGAVLVTGGALIVQ